MNAPLQGLLGPIALACALACSTGAALAQSMPAACAQPATAIGTVQGSTDTSPFASQTVTVQGVVVGDFEGPTGTLRGVYLQDAGDGNAATSDGIFVFLGTGSNVASVGQVLRITGTVSEFQGQTQITATAASVIACGTGSVAPTDISLPWPDAAYAERYEGMLVRLPQTLTVTEHFQLGRFGQVVVSANGRQLQPTNVVAPGAAALALDAANQLGRVIVDDNAQSQNPDPIVFGRGGLPLSASNTLRGGDTITGLTGVLTYTWSGNSASGNAWRVRPLAALGGGTPQFVASNPRPAAAPQQAAGSLRVAGFNVLNFFNNVAGCTGGTGGAAMDCRGAGSDISGAANQATQFATEYPRQLAKTVAAIVKMDAAVVGLMEIENDGYGASSAQQTLVNALNAATSAGRYALIDVDARTGQTNAAGTDAIKVALIYQPAKARPVGRTAVLNSTAFVTGGDGSQRNRPAVTQAFEQPDGARVVVVVNHLKSKGSACDAPDAGDGQGNCNAVRVNAARTLRTWLASDPTGTQEPDALVIGDLNSYAKEDPIAEFTNNGWRDLVLAFNGVGAAGYAFNGQWGYLDHALASPTLGGQVAGTTHWHINADEPSVLDYNVNFKSAGQIASLYAPDEFRNSDHDPAIIDLALRAPTVLRGTAASEAITGGAADEVLIGGPGRDLLTGGGGRNQFAYTSVLDGGDTITDFVAGRDSVVVSQLLRSIGAPANALASGHLVCTASGANAQLLVDTDGSTGPAPARPLVLVRNIGCASLVQADNLRL